MEILHLLYHLAHWYTIHPKVFYLAPVADDLDNGFLLRKPAGAFDLMVFLFIQNDCPCILRDFFNYYTVFWHLVLQFITTNIEQSFIYS